MSSIYFGVYRDAVMSLARSVVIKFDHVADAVNEQLRILGQAVDDEKPETWKYYMNLAGEYHSTDVMMSVRSMDTLEMIDFTKENLLLHRATAREYVPGKYYYDNLVRSFPDQAGLINGILYPIDIEKAINSDNGDILYFDPKYVDENEYTFAHALQDWVRVFYTRWYNDSFNLTDDLYLASFLGHLYGKLPLSIMLIRLKNAKTPRAHSFHIREHLASNGRLDEFIPYLTKSQQLYLYRNINYIERNVGKQELFDELVKEICTARGIPLVRYSIKQNTENMPTELYPTVDMTKSDVNYPVVQENMGKVTVGYLLGREDSLARDNAKVKFDAEIEIIDKVRSDQFSILPTKVLDSEVIDRSNSSVRSLTHVLLNNWLHLATSGRYRAYVQIPNPQTGELMAVTVKDAFILAIYAYYRVWDLLPTKIPQMNVYEVLRSPLPNFQELSAKVQAKYTPAKVIRAIQDGFTPLRSYISTEQFYLDSAQFHQEYLKQWELYSFQEHPMGRAQAENTVKSHYINRTCTLVDTPTSFEAYFAASGIQVTDLSKPDYEQLAVDCINIATGANLYEVITLGSIQRELLRLMGRLTSYPLQFLRNVAFTDFHVVGVVAARVGDVDSEASAYMHVPVANIDVQTYRTAGAHWFQVGEVVITPSSNYTYTDEGRWPIDPCVNITETSFNGSSYYLSIAHVTVHGVSITTEETPNTTGVLDQYQNSTDPTWPILKE